MTTQVKIDELALLTQQAKELDARIKMIKDELVNSLGEGKFRGVQFGVTISLYSSTVVEYKKLVEELQVPADKVAEFSRQNAVIRCASTL